MSKLRADNMKKNQPLKRNSTEIDLDYSRLLVMRPQKSLLCRQSRHHHNSHKQDSYITTFNKPNETDIDQYKHI